MHTSNDEHGKPVLDLDKAPYGHTDEHPLGTAFEEGSAAPIVGMTDEQIQSNAEALRSFADEDTPVFPPTNVGIENADESQFLPGPHGRAAEAEGNDQEQDTRSLRALVKARPLASILLAAVFGAVCVHVLQARADSRS